MKKKVQKKDKVEIFLSLKEDLLFCLILFT